MLTDVDAPGSRVVFLTPDGESLGSFDVPVSSGAGTLSFLGATFDAGERVGAVRVISGTARIGTAEGANADVVALDDVIYGEPQPTPPTPVLQFAAERVEGAERNGLVYVQVTRTGDLGRVSRVALTNEPGSATLDDDYAAASGTLAFPRGSDHATAVIRLVRSAAVEPEESFSVDLQRHPRRRHRRARPDHGRHRPDPKAARRAGAGRSPRGRRSPSSAWPRPSAPSSRSCCARV